mgnify:CR=1 FL=1
MASATPAPSGTLDFVGCFRRVTDDPDWIRKVLIGGGFVLIAAAWRVLYEAQRAGTLATAGPYDYLRHPQYVGFILVMFGFLLQWPTLVTLAMFPILVFMYWRLAQREEREVAATFGEEYARYRAATPAFVPKFGGGRPAGVA